MRMIWVLSAALLLSGCVSVPPNVFVVTPELLELRQQQTRRYEGLSREDLLVAGSNVLQDLGYNLGESETSLGVLTADKQRDATSGAEVTAAVFVALLGGGAMAISKDQTIRVSLVVRSVNDSAGNAIPDNNYVRVNFHRVVRRTDNSVFVETLDSPELYQEFHNHLSKAVFLEAHQV